MMDMDRLWELAGNQGEGIKVAMLDTGIDVTHPEFKGANIIHADLCGGKYTGDIDGHGTQCCGVISRIAPRCTLLSGRILIQSGSFTNDALISGLFWASRQEAQIICVCTGDRYPDPDVHALLKDFHDEGRLVVAAIGNRGVEGGGMFPARYKHVVATGTADPDGSLAGFTELAADKEVVCLPGIEFTVPIPGGLYKSVTGTSMSAAAMSALMALWLRQKRDYGQISQAIVNCSDVHQSSRGSYRVLDPVRLFSPAC